MVLLDCITNQTEFKMIHFKFGCIIFIVCFLQATGLSINSCVPDKQNDSECSTYLYIPKGGLKGLKVGPQFIVKGKLLLLLL